MLLSLSYRADGMRALHVFFWSLAASGSVFPAIAQSDPSPFDGTWDVALHCPVQSGEDDAKGYERQFSAEIKNGTLRGVYGTEGAPGSHVLAGTLDAAGSAMLRVEGVVNNPDYVANTAVRGKPYNYRVKAQFSADRGTGERIGRRVCNFLFTRR